MHTKAKKHSKPRKRAARKVKAGYVKVWFSSPHGETAGLILPYDKERMMNISDISRLFPVSEFRKMKRYHSSPVFKTWDEAFEFSK